MTPEYSLTLLSKKIASGKPFNPSEWDKKAINTLIEYHNNENTKTARYKGNFIKLYTMCFKIFLSRNKCLIIGQKAMSSIMSKPLNTITDDFTERLNELELNHWMDEKGFVSELNALISEQDKQKNLKIAEDNLDEYLSYTDGIWKKDEVKNNLITQAQIALNRF